MRMWMVDPGLMCDRHLLGEHVELHMLVGSIRRRKRLDGFIRNGLVELDAIASRHADLVAEMGRRGFRHRSPLDDVSELAASSYPPSRVPRREAARELRRRCSTCRARRPRPT